MVGRTEICFLGRNLRRMLKNGPAQHCPTFSRHNATDSFLTGHSSQFIENMYNAWITDPASVHPSWDAYFRQSDLVPSVSEASVVNEIPVPTSPEVTVTVAGTEKAGAPIKTLITKPPPVVRTQKLQRRHHHSVEIHHNLATIPECEKSVREHLVVHNIIRSFQVRGYQMAKLDPMGINVPDSSELLSKYKLEEEDLNKEFTIPPNVFIGGKEEKLPLREIIARLDNIYCKHIGAEYMYIPENEPCNWIRQQLETPGIIGLTPKEKKLVLERLIEATQLELFLGKKWPTEKRFGLEGCEMMIPAVKCLIDRSTELGVENFVIGMAHRGRLNVLVNVCRRPLYQVLTQFQTLDLEDGGSGDVKYHLGTYVERINRVTSKMMRMILLANPSHLETVNGIVQGRAKAEQYYRGDCDGAKTLSILIHGDAAFSGQGVVYESVNLSALPCFTPFGTVHVVINNQIGYTTEPRFNRSSPNCTDVARVANAPILHVNADVPDSVIHVSKIAAEWRAIFRKDVVLDLVCYRRNGHSENEDPMFTQPFMYTKIKKIQPILVKYSKQLIAEGVVKEEQVKKHIAKIDKFCDDELVKAQKEKKIRIKDWIESPWPGFFSNRNPNKVEETGISEKSVKHILNVFSSPPLNRPEDFVIHKSLERILKHRQELIAKKLFDVPMAEALAFGALLKDGIHVRISGEDTERGGFSQRHHIVHHQTVDRTFYNPLNHLYPDQAKYIICNSSLSEYGVLCFEYGYSMANPNSLVIFEAQFGDFVNTAQAVVDTMICCGEAKWGRQCGLVLMLPHGLDGGGPEHSSARIERYLQLSSDDPDNAPDDECDNYEIEQLRHINWFVAYPTTPANLFHVLRRQIALPFRKPLALMIPKILFRSAEARSSFSEVCPGTCFRRLIPDEGPASKQPEGVKRLIFCTGKVFYLLREEFKKKGVDCQIAISRIEQLTPFPFDLVKQEVMKYPKAEIVWCQEEHKNQGAWLYAGQRINTAICGYKPVHYVGRPVSESAATGYKALHTKEIENFLKDASSLGDCK